ncbi:MAG: HDOD domain-containing protein [Gammaproteobacteria bacterium]|nr:HDOD domain-containing protein [Gammaproteobacteria bacterium]MBU0770676.1 HDOD domain-containing protein [Gammaproteobacteria bacterium]MBU0857550.1 HDOD domain-containing protein [Gammaproteobacteria bacterium]MBU1848706.1 HDOD domain-containing protein [Gammaproteobacteria bacterium]
MLFGAHSIPAIADAALGRQDAAQHAVPLSAMLRCDPVFVLRLLRASEVLDRPAGETVAARVDAVIDACGPALIQAALIDTHRHAGSESAVPTPYRDFWVHSVLTAETARELSLRCGNSDPDMAHVAGLLLDVSLPLLAHSVDHSRLFAHGVDEHAFHALEHAEFGVTHAELGAALLPADWGGELADAVRFHHTDVALFGDAPELLRIARAAETLSGGGAGDAMQHAAMAHALTGLSVEHLNDAWQSACRSAAGKLVALQLADPAVAVLEGGVYRPRFAVRHADRGPDVPRVFELARDGLFTQAFPISGELEIWRRYALAAALLFDLGRPGILLAQPGTRRFAARDDAGEPGLPPLDFAHPALDAVWAGLRAGQPWYGDEAAFAGALPVSLQRLLHAGDDCVCLVLPVVSDAGVEALAVHRIPVARAAALRTCGAGVGALARACARALREAKSRERSLGELRHSMSEQYSAHTKQLRGDLHTPLGLLRHQVKSMRLKMGADSMLESELTVFADQLVRIDAVLRHFESRPPDVATATQWTDINALIEQAVHEADARALRARSITTELHFDAALPPLHLPLATMRDIVATLLDVSAAQIGSSGRIAISTADGVNVNGRLFAEIRIRDFGRGMDAARVAALFAREGGEGAGERGLAQALAQTMALGGSLSCKSAIGQGTVFQLLLPRQTRRGAATSGKA